MENENSDLILAMENISKSFPGVKALADVSFYLRKGSVHALMGENGAGKSTLMKCLFGIYLKDAGSIKIDGKEFIFNSTKEALEHGISMVHQELNLVTQTRVVDNIWLGRFPKKHGVVDEKFMYEETLKIFEEFDINIDPLDKVSTLSVSQMQMIEIAKAVSYNARVIVMDEPTSSLSEKEVEHLFKIIRKLQKTDCAIIYISHKMDEIETIADEITIMRDGILVATDKVKNLGMDKIISLMVGRDMDERFPDKTNTPHETLLKVESLYGFTIENISFDLRKGEVLGFAGLIGSKRSDVVETIFGIRHLHHGKIIYKEKIIHNKSPRDAIKNGFSLVTEERRKTGIFPTASVAFNSLVVAWTKVANKFRILNNSLVSKNAGVVISNMNVKTPSQSTQIKFLSGGNQQKVILGRWLLSEPEILLLDEPTRGIDVGAKFEIYKLINDLAASGKSIIMVSSEMPELIGITDRILVMSNGRVAGIVNTKETSQEEILKLAAKYI